MLSSANYDDKYSTLKGNAMKIELTEQDIDLILASIANNIAEEQQYIERYHTYRPRACQYTKLYIAQLEDIRNRLMQAQLNKEIKK